MTNGFIKGVFKLEKVTVHVAKLLVCSKCDKATDGAEMEKVVMCDGMEIVKGFCYLGDRLNASGGCEAEVTARTDWDERNSESVKKYYLEKDSLCR